MRRLLGYVLLGVVLVSATPRASFAQATLTSTDIQRLQYSVDDATRDITALRARDASLATQLQAQLDDVRDEIVYLKVKLRKNEPVSRAEYNDVRDRIDGLRDQARGTAAKPPAALPAQADPDRRGPTSAPYRQERTMDVPVGTEFDVRLQSSLNSGTARVEDRFEATTIVDLKEGDRVVVPAGSVMRGIVNSVKPAGRVERTGSLTIVFDRITLRGRSYPIHATVTQALESDGVRGEAGKIGVGAGVGAVIGAILGGAKGALAGVLIGGGGTIAATEGKDADLPPGTVLRVRLDSGLDLR
jgi:hypothetical protein